MITKASFQRFLRGICLNNNVWREFRWASNAVLALQEASESYIVGLFEDVNMLAIHANRSTIRVVDLKLAQRIRGDVRAIDTDYYNDIKSKSLAKRVRGPQRE